MRSGGAEEQGASRQGDSPCTRPAKKKTVFSSGFPHVAWGTVRQGPVRPPYPRQQGHRPCTLPAMEETYRTYFFPHETSGNGMSAHGRNENVEKSRSGRFPFLPVFLISPGCKASVRRCSPSSPRNGSSSSRISARYSPPRASATRRFMPPL